MIKNKIMYNFDVLVIKETTEIDKISEKTLYPIDTKDRADVFCDFGHNDLILFPNICGLSVRTSNHKKPSNSSSTRRDWRSARVSDRIPNKSAYPRVRRAGFLPWASPRSRP